MEAAYQLDVKSFFRGNVQVNYEHQRLPRAVELAARIVAGHVQRTETSPEAFASLLSSAYKAIRALERLEAEDRAREQAKDASEGLAEGSSGSRARQTRKRSRRIDVGQLRVEEGQRGFGDDAADLPHVSEATPIDPERDLAEGYVRHGVQTVTAEHLVSLDDMRKVTFLGRHLRASGTDVADYKRRWKLPPDYPMTAPAYVERRREAAKEQGFGRDLRPTRESRNRTPLRSADTPASEPRRRRRSSPAAGQIGSENG